MLQFYKYHGTGNDFVLFDNRSGEIARNRVEFFAAVCHRRFGVGADGVILLENHPDYDFEMFYVNADGRPTSMCGNGGRCIVAFAKKLGVIDSKASFLAIDGPHEASIEDDRVKLKMGLPGKIHDLENGDHWVHTGSPHYVQFMSDSSAQDFDVQNEGRRIRNLPEYHEAGTNVNFVWDRRDHLYVRTYERGVEDETWSCGTGVTAVSLVYHRLQSRDEAPVKIQTPGGELTVHIEKEKAPILEGPAVELFSGSISPNFSL